MVLFTQREREYDILSWEPLDEDLFGDFTVTSGLILIQRTEG